MDREHDVICYGVRNAKDLRLEPPVENLTPSLIRFSGWNRNRTRRTGW
jgi:hypothetical protein